MPGPSNNLEALLIANGSNQSQLAEELKIDRANVSRWITGERSITKSQIPKICEALDCTIEELILAYPPAANDLPDEPA